MSEDTQGMVRRSYRGGYTEFTREKIYALGSLPLWGDSKFDFKS